MSAGAEEANNSGDPVDSVVLESPPNSTMAVERGDRLEIMET